jgi:hypothetical protein
MIVTSSRDQIPARFKVLSENGRSWRDLAPTEDRFLALAARSQGRS